MATLKPILKYKFSTFKYNRYFSSRTATLFSGSGYIQQFIRGQRDNLFNNSRISIVDDDRSFRESLGILVKSAGYGVAVFASAEEFLKSGSPAQTDCLILDLKMPGMNGLDLHRRVMALNYAIPTVFITAHGNEDDRTRALKEGAVDFLYKPFSEQDIMTAIDAAIRSGNHLKPEQSGE